MTSGSPAPPASGPRRGEAVVCRVRDVDGTYRDALYTFQLGFDGKMLLSPRQIEPIHRAFQDGLSAGDERPF